MKVYTYSKARQKLAKLLDDARREGPGSDQTQGRADICYKTGRRKKSPLDIAGVSTDISLDELNEALRESRDKFCD